MNYCVERLSRNTPRNMKPNRDRNSFPKGKERHNKVASTLERAEASIRASCNMQMRCRLTLPYLGRRTALLFGLNVIPRNGGKRSGSIVA